MWLDVVQLVVVRHGAEPRDRHEDPWRVPLARDFGTRVLEARVATDVVGPSDAILVQQPGDVRPPIRHLADFAEGLALPPARVLLVRLTAARIRVGRVELRAPRGPSRRQE